MWVRSHEASALAEPTALIHPPHQRHADDPAHAAFSKQKANVTAYLISYPGSTGNGTVISPAPGTRLTMALADSHVRLPIAGGPSALSKALGE